MFIFVSAFLLFAQLVAPSQAQSAGCRPNADIAIVFDSSGSRKDEYEEQRQVILDVLKDVYIGNEADAARVAFVEYSGSTKVVLQLSSAQTTDSVLTAIKERKLIGGTTKTVAAVQAALQELKAAKKEGRRQVFVLISDGNSFDPWPEVLSTVGQLSASGAFVYVVTVAANPGEDELRLYSGGGDAAHLFLRARVDDFKRDFRQRLGGDPALCGATPAPEKKPTTGAPVVDAPTEAPRCAGAKKDVVFVLDSSGSVEEAFNANRQFILDVVEGLDIGSQSARVGLVEFSGGSETKIRWEDNADKRNVVRIVKDLKFLGGVTNIVGAVNLGKQLLSGARADASPVLVLVSDGQSQNDWEQVVATAKSLRDAKIDVHCVALTNEYSDLELGQYATSPDKIYHGTDAAKAKQALVSALGQSNCEQTPPPNKVEVLPSIDEKPKCSNGKADIVVIFDSSGSVSEIFEKERELASSLVRDVSIGPDAVRVAGIQYSAESKVVIPLNAPGGKDAVLAAIKGMVFTGGTTHTADAVILATEHLRTTRRSDATPVVLLLSDGSSYDEWAKVLLAAKGLRDVGALTFAVSVAPNGYRPELVVYAGDEARAYLDGEVNKFKQDFIRFLAGSGTTAAVGKSVAHP